MSSRYYEFRLSFGGTTARGYVHGADIWAALAEANVWREILAQGVAYTLRVSPV